MTVYVWRRRGEFSDIFGPSKKGAYGIGSTEPSRVFSSKTRSGLYFPLQPHINTISDLHRLITHHFGDTEIASSDISNKVSDYYPRTTFQPLLEGEWSELNDRLELTDESSPSETPSLI